MTPAGKIFLCLVLSLATAIIIRILLGKKRDLWFERKVPKSFITMRTKLSMYVAIGTPKTVQGAAVACILLAAVTLERLAVCFFL